MPPEPDPEIVDHLRSKGVDVPPLVGERTSDGSDIVSSELGILTVTFRGVSISDARDILEYVKRRYDESVDATWRADHGSDPVAID